MYEPAPAGFSQAMPACLKIAKAHWPECFDGDDADADYYSSILHIVLRQPELFGEDTKLESGILAFGRAFNSVRRALADGRFAAYVMDSRASLKAVSGFRRWASDDGLDELLLDDFFDGTTLEKQKILLPDEVIAKFIPKDRKVASAKGRDLLVERLMATMKAAPEIPTPKRETLDRAAADLELSDRQKLGAWTEAAKSFPAWSRPGRRKHSSPI